MRWQCRRPRGAPTLAGQESSGKSLELPRRAIGRSDPVHPRSFIVATVEVGHPQGFQHGGSGEDVEGLAAERQLRFARSALNPYSVALHVLPASSVLKILP